MSSADTTPISSARFAIALKDLSIETLHLKVLEIRNSIAHLQYSNDQLQPFAQGTSTPLDSLSAQEPDQDCIDAIKENELVIDRMAERIALVRMEVEDRGVSWTEFQSKEEIEAAKAEVEVEIPAMNGVTNGEAAAERSSPWTDGTFQTGTIRNGEIQMDAQPGRPQGGSLSDEELRRRLEERMRELNTDDDPEGGMHL